MNVQSTGGDVSSRVHPQPVDAVAVPMDIGSGKHESNETVSVERPTAFSEHINLPLEETQTMVRQMSQVLRHHAQSETKQDEEHRRISSMANKQAEHHQRGSTSLSATDVSSTSLADNEDLGLEDRLEQHTSTGGSSYAANTNEDVSAAVSNEDQLSGNSILHGTMSNDEELSAASEETNLVDAPRGPSTFVSLVNSERELSTDAAAESVPEESDSSLIDFHDFEPIVGRHRPVEMDVNYNGIAVDGNMVESASPRSPYKEDPEDNGKHEQSEVVTEVVAAAALADLIPNVTSSLRKRMRADSFTTTDIEDVLSDRGDSNGNQSVPVKTVHEIQADMISGNDVDEHQKAVDRNTETLDQQSAEAVLLSAPTHSPVFESELASGVGPIMRVDEEHASSMLEGSHCRVTIGTLHTRFSIKIVQ